MDRSVCRSLSYEIQKRMLGKMSAVDGRDLISEFSVRSQLFRVSIQSIARSTHRFFWPLASDVSFFGEDGKRKVSKRR